MTTRVQKPERFMVTTNIEGVPISITRDGKGERVTRIYKEWRTSEPSQTQETVKRCFRVRTSRGLIYDICRDTISNVWYLSKVYN